MPRHVELKDTILQQQQHDMQQFLKDHPFEESSEKEQEMMGHRHLFGTNSNGIDIDMAHLFPFEKDIDANTKHQLNYYVQSIRDPYYESHPAVVESLTYDIYNCPDIPPDFYPEEYPIVDIITNWNPDNTTFPSIEQRPKIYSAICRFDYNTPGHTLKALNYRKAEVPFILRNDPAVLQVVQRWTTPNYLSTILNENGPMYKTEVSESNHLMYFRESAGKRKSNSKNMYEDWKPPMTMVRMTYDEWVDKASQPLDQMTPDDPHYYFRVSGKTSKLEAQYHKKYREKEQRQQQEKKKHFQKPAISSKHEMHFLFQELPFFEQRANFYIVDENDTRGINCRFGMNGNIAEAHFDGSRNFVMLFGGERRYVLSHPKHCKNLGLFPSSHPSGRHSSLNWSNPDLFTNPEFVNAEGNEVVLQAGDVLYLPTHWFHFIISLNMNWQCNARSGITRDYYDIIKDCGF